jgi:Carbohydrate family 9 binding domain-like
MDRFVTVVVCVIVCACSKPAEPTFDRRLRLVSSSVPAAAAAGETVSVNVRFAVDDNCIGTQPKIKIHADAIHIDRVLGATSPLMWHVGDVIEQTITVLLPSVLQTDYVDVDVGISEERPPEGKNFEGGWRWPVAAGSDARIDDVQRSVRIGRIAISGAQKNTIDVPRAQLEPVIDGVANDDAWKNAATFGPFVAWDLASPVTRTTTVKMVWRDHRLFTLFVMDDPDAHSPFVAHDDPLYEGETWEMFVDADGDGDDYSELQANVRDVTFDASFHGGARKNMSVGFSPVWTTRTIVDRDAHTVTSEWSIDASTLVDVAPGPLGGTTWAVNLFRLERLRNVAGAVTSIEATAWRAPQARDFHTLSRFGRVHFREQKERVDKGYGAIK